MITRAYQNAKGDRQEVTLSQTEWESIDEDGLKEILGFNEPKPAPKPKPKPRVRKKK